jgi:pyruvate formate lyase activating enzyme
MSLSDWPGKIAAVIFLGGCDFRCPYCHNSPLVLKPAEFEPIPFEMVESYIECHLDFLDAVIVTGGEPTIHPWLGELFFELKNAGVSTRLDTNGSRPDVIEKLIRERRLGSIAMDVKAASAEEYKAITGVEADFEKVKRSIEIIKLSGLPHTFRTTVVPGFHDADHLKRICAIVRGGLEYRITDYRARNEADIIDPDWVLSQRELARGRAQAPTILSCDELPALASTLSEIIPTTYVKAA